MLSTESIAEQIVLFVESYWSIWGEMEPFVLIGDRSIKLTVPQSQVRQYSRLSKRRAKSFIKYCLEGT